MKYFLLFEEVEHLRKNQVFWSGLYDPDKPALSPLLFVLRWFYKIF